MSASTPQLLGFAEPISNIPPVEEFLPPHREPPLQPPRPAPLAGSVPEPEPRPHRAPLADAVVPPSEPPAVPAIIRARGRDLPPRAAAPSVRVLSERPTNLVGRLGRRLGEIYAPLQDGPPRFEKLPPSPTPRARRVPEPPPRARETPGISPAAPDEPAPALDRPPEPRPKPVTPGPAPLPEGEAEHGGRPPLPRNRRLHRRAKLPAEMEIDGVPCTLIDVSIGGFAATGVQQLAPNALVPVMLRLTIDGIEVGTLLQARIIYVTQGRSSGRFVELSPSQMAFLRYIVTWRGESIGAVGTTTLLDAISIGGGRDFSSGAGDPDIDTKSRWWAGLIGRSVKPPR